MEYYFSHNQFTEFYKNFKLQDYFCFDFCNESNGIFVLGVSFFLRQISTFYPAIFDGIF